MLDYCKCFLVRCNIKCYYLFFIILALPLTLIFSFVSCNEKDNIIFSNKERLSLESINLESDSRARIDDSTLPDGHSIGVSLVDGSGITYDNISYNNIQVTSSRVDNNQIWTPKTDLWLSQTDGTLYAYYPYSDAVSDITAVPVASGTTDYLFASVVQNLNNTNHQATVHMKHALVALNINVCRTLDNPYDAELTALSIKSNSFFESAVLDVTSNNGLLSDFSGQGFLLEKKALSQSLSYTGTNYNFLVVTDKTPNNITFTATIDGKDYTAVAENITFKQGYIYSYTLSFSKQKEVVELALSSVESWEKHEKVSLDMTMRDPWLLPNGVYAVTADRLPIAVSEADESCVAVALVVNDAPVSQYIMIEKNEYNNESYADNTTAYMLYDDVLPSGTLDNYGLSTYNTVDGVSSLALLPSINGNYKESAVLNKISVNYNAWTAGALSDWQGDKYSSMLSAVANRSYCIGKILETFNNSDVNNLGYSDWYVPAAGQLALIFMYIDLIDEALEKIQGVPFMTNYRSYYSSTLANNSQLWGIDCDELSFEMKDACFVSRNVRFIRNIDVDTSGDIPVNNTELLITGNTYGIQFEKENLSDGSIKITASPLFSGGYVCDIDYLGTASMSQSIDENTGVRTILMSGSNIGGTIYFNGLYYDIAYDGNLNNLNISKSMDKYGNYTLVVEPTKADMQIQPVTFNGTGNMRQTVNEQTGVLTIILSGLQNPGTLVFNGAAYDVDIVGDTSDMTITKSLDADGNYTVTAISLVGKTIKDVVYTGSGSMTQTYNQNTFTRTVSIKNMQSDGIVTFNGSYYDVSINGDVSDISITKNIDSNGNITITAIPDDSERNVDYATYVGTGAIIQNTDSDTGVLTININDLSTAGNLTFYSTYIRGTIDLSIAENGIYAVSKNGLGLTTNKADNSCIAVALIEKGATVPQRFMIEKNWTNNTTSIKAAYKKNGLNYSNTGWFKFSPEYVTLPNIDSFGDYNIADLVSSWFVSLQFEDGSYSSDDNQYQISRDQFYSAGGAMSDFNGKANTLALQNVDFTNYDSPDFPYMATWCTEFNGTETENQGYTDWYIPALGQLVVIFKYISPINDALSKIGGAQFDILYLYNNPTKNTLLSSTQCSNNKCCFSINMYSGVLSSYGIGQCRPVRFIRDIIE